MVTNNQESSPADIPKVVVEKSEAEQAAALEKRKEHGRRLQEMQAKQRADKVRLKSRIS
jgi:hypothetical protein